MNVIYTIFKAVFPSVLPFVFRKLLLNTYELSSKDETKSVEKL